MQAVPQDSKWQNYYENTSKSDKPWETLEKAVKAFNEEKEVERTAVDLGCGVGKDAAHMVAHDWRVTAVDAEMAAREFLMKKIPADKRDRINFVVSTYEDFRFTEKVKLVNASLALPFCTPKALPSVMERIKDAILPGGRFAGHFFGPNDSWAKIKSDESTLPHSFTSETEVREFFAERFTVEHIEEKEWDGPSGSGPKHWHRIDVVAKKV